MTVVAAFVLASLGLTQTFCVASTSMQPTLAPGDRVLLAPHVPDPPAIGDVVVFWEPGTDQLSVKRVIGAAGDTVALEDGRLRRNGRMVEEPYADLGGAGSTYFGPVRVPEGTTFVMGDNRGVSVDSRSYGPVEQIRIVGRVVARVWPPTRP